MCYPLSRKRERGQTPPWLEGAKEGTLDCEVGGKKMIFCLQTVGLYSVSANFLGCASLVDAYLRSPSELASSHPSTEARVLEGRVSHLLTRRIRFLTRSGGRAAPYDPYCVFSTRSPSRKCRS